MFGYHLLKQNKNLTILLKLIAKIDDSSHSYVEKLIPSEHEKEDSVQPNDAALIKFPLALSDSQTFEVHGNYPKYSIMSAIDGYLNSIDISILELVCK